jgi:hypothetical protein
VSFGTLDELGFEGPDELLPQAAKASAAHAAIDVRASLRLVRNTNETTSFVGSALHAQMGIRANGPLWAW